MLEPQTPKLRIGKCVSESFTAWTGNLPVLFLATLLAILLAFIPPFLFGVATITGLLLIMLDAIAGDPARLRDVIRPLRNPVRFVFLNSFLLFGVILWMGTLFVLGVGILPASTLPEPISSHAESIRELVALRVSGDVLNWLPAYQSPPHN